MLAAIFNATLRILTFRAGPQDFPYDPKLTAPLALAAAAATGLQGLQSVSLPAAVLSSIIAIAVMGLVTRAVLNMRQLESRFHQTFCALLATTAVLTLLFVPFFAQIVPVLHQAEANPEIFQDPVKLQAMDLPLGSFFMMFVIWLWSFSVTIWIYKQALNSSVFLAVVVTLAVGLMMQVFAGSVAALLSGKPA
ncbi:MAG: hypothetical protein ACREVL_18490 [Solimonas sp.]